MLAAVLLCMLMQRHAALSAHPDYTCIREVAMTTRITQHWCDWMVHVHSILSGPSLCVAADLQSWTWMLL